MVVTKFQGTDKKLYELICPLVMSPAVLRQNNNYPFKTGSRYIWYVAIEGEQVEGFMPVKRTSTDYHIIDNYYIKGDDESVLCRMLATVIADKARQGELWAVTHKRHVEQFVKNDFCSRIEWKNYHKMQYCRMEDAVCAN